MAIPTVVIGLILYGLLNRQGLLGDGEVGIAMMLGGNIEGFTRTMTTAIALETNKGSFDFALGLGFMLLVIAFFVNIILHYFQLKIK